MTNTSSPPQHDSPQNPAATAERVTVIGLGLMGQALAAALVDSGHPTTVWNRSPDKAAPLVDRGAVLGTSARDAVAASPLVVVCVSDYDAMHALLDPLADVLEGQVLVNLTSGTSGDARATAERAAGWGTTYLDGAIMAVPQAIGSDAVVNYSGPRAAFDEHEATLRSFGSGATYLGTDHALASLYDVAVLGLMWSILDGFLHGAALLGAAGVDATSFATLAAESATMIGSWLPGYAEQIDEGVYPALDSTINTHVGAMDHLVLESETLQINTELPRYLKALGDRAVAAGRGGDGYAALIEQFRVPAPE